MSPMTTDDYPILSEPPAPNPLRADGLYPVLVSPGIFEALVDRVEWGEPDDDGFYTPTLYRETPQAALRSPARDLGGSTSSPKGT